MDVFQCMHEIDHVNGKINKSSIKIPFPVAGFGGSKDGESLIDIVITLVS